jgi:hypothetical protein
MLKLKEKEQFSQSQSDLKYMDLNRKFFKLLSVSQEFLCFDIFHLNTTYGHATLARMFTKWGQNNKAELKVKSYAMTISMFHIVILKMLTINTFAEGGPKL